MINNEQILVYVYIQGYDHHQKQMKIFQHNNHWWQELDSFIYDDTDGHISNKRKTLVDCRLFLFTRSKHKNYRLFDLLENNDSCYTLIYFLSVYIWPIIFLVEMEFFFHWSQCYYYIYIYVNIYKKKRKENKRANMLSLTSRQI
jgi:hypothetical protein